MLLGDDGKPLNTGCDKSSNTGTILNGETSKEIANFHTLVALVGNGADVAIPIRSVLKVMERLENIVLILSRQDSCVFGGWKLC